MLTEIACKAATCPPDKARARFSDVGALYLEVAPKWFQALVLEVLLRRKRKALALGSYPAAKLKDARTARDDARKLLQQAVVVKVDVAKRW